MRKVITVTSTNDYNVEVCDVCLCENRSGIFQDCEICDKDLCHTCAKNNIQYGYSIKFCPKCFELVKHKMNKLDEHVEAISKIKNEIYNDIFELKTKREKE